MINPKILILPDIHGRAFYQKALSEAVDKDAEIVCLGDYLGPYPGHDLHERGVFAPLKELVEVKKQYPERVHHYGHPAYISLSHCQEVPGFSQDWKHLFQRIARCSSTNTLKFQHG